MEPDDGPEEDGPFFAWLPPDDRLWRHPSEVPQTPQTAAGAGTPSGRHGSGPRWSAGRSALWARPSGAATRTWTIAVIAGVVGALAASGIGMVSGAFEYHTTVIRSVTPTGPAVSLASTGGAAPDWTTVDDEVAPSVVSIDVNSPSGQVSGSGVLLVPGVRYAYLVTDQSLLAGGGTIEVTFLSGEQDRGRVIGQDPLTGLALIAVPNSNRIFPTVGSVDTLQVADPVLAVGARAPSGGSVFPASVSAQDRAVDLSNGTTMDNLIALSSPDIPDTTAGGPLVDQQGRVVGITLGIDPTDSNDQQYSFAVPVDVAEHVASQMLASRSVTHPWLGVTDAVDLASQVASEMGLTGGAKVGAVSPYSPASRLGIKPSDIITSFDGHPVTSSGSLVELLGQSVPGQSIAISYLDQGKPKSATVVVSNQPGS
ncbi:MAG: S1C family serine protease [Acidimicrobiales bacterium]